MAIVYSTNYTNSWRIAYKKDLPIALLFPKDKFGNYVHVHAYIYRIKQNVYIF